MWFIVFIILFLPFLKLLIKKNNNASLYKQEQDAMSEKKEMEINKKFPSEKADSLYDINIRFFKKSLTEFLKTKYKENFKNWDALEPTRVLIDNPIAITLTLTYKVEHIYVVKINSTKGYEFCILDEPKPDEPSLDEPKPDEPSPDEPKPNEPKLDESDSGEFVRKWYKKNITFLEEEKKKCIENEYDYFLYDKSKIPNHLEDIKLFLELKGFYIVYDDEEIKVFI